MKQEHSTPPLRIDETLIETSELKATHQQEGAKVRKNSKEGNSASQQNQKDMEDKVKAVDSEIEEIAKKEAEELDKHIHPKQKDDFKKYLKGSLERGYKRVLEEENEQKEKGDTGPSRS